MTMIDPQAAKTGAQATNPAAATRDVGGVAPGKQTLTSQVSPTETKKPAKPLTKQEAFVHKYAASAAALENKDGIPALFTLAQGALESGWGEKAIDNALFGIKAGASWTGKKQLVTTTEYFPDDKHGDKFPEVISITKVADNKYKYVVKDYFRDYDTVEEGLADHSAFLITNKRYAPAFNTTTPEAFAQAVADAGYATAGGYGATLKSMIASVKSRWPQEVAMPSGNAKAETGGKPGGAAPHEPVASDKPHAADAGGAAVAGGTPAAHTEQPHAQPESGAKKPAQATGKTIGASVGENGANKPADALVVKELMIKAGYALTNTPAVGPKTVADIKDFQQKTLGWKTPDGLIEPGGKTFHALESGAPAVHHAPTAEHPAVANAENHQNNGAANHTAANTPGKATQPATAESVQSNDVGAKLDKFYADFSHVTVAHGDKTVIIKPPYYINTGPRQKKALEARAANPKVAELVNKLVSGGEITANAKIGKSQPSDLKVILEAAVNDGMVSFEAGAMTEFLANYGLSVDCSGYVSQALNSVMDGNEKQDKGDGLKPENTGSGSLEGGQGQFTKVAIDDIEPGDTMHLSGHIRIVNQVVHDGKIMFFRTTESTAAVNPDSKENGLAKRWWKWDGSKTYVTWASSEGNHPDSADKSWKVSNEADTYGRYKKLPAPANVG